MLLSLTNITGLVGLMIIFISAGLLRNGMGWLLGVIFLLLILVIRNALGEVTKTQEVFLSLLIFVIVLATLLLIN